MENLEKFNSVELTQNELDNINGGLMLLLFGAACFGAGVAVGYAVGRYLAG